MSIEHHVTPASDDTTDYLPSRVYLKESDHEEDVIQALEQQYNVALEAWGERERERTLQRATRYTDDDPRPEFPLIMRSRSRQQAPRFALMPNGQRVLWVGTHRVQTLCGIQVTLELTEAILQFKHPGGREQCPSCEGRHLSKTRVALSRPTPTPTTLECPKCHIDASANYVPEGHDTLKCLACGHRIYRSGPVAIQEPVTLEAEEVEHNEAAINQALFTNEDDADLGSDDEVTLGEWETDELTEDSLEYSCSHEIEPDTFEDISADELDLKDAIDRLHAPAFELFTKGHTPLRQNLVELMLQGQEQEANKTLHWIIAGQCSRDGIDLVPHTNPDGTRASIAEWLNSLSAEELLSLAGSPDTEHPILSHPMLEHFLSLDPLTYPLEKALYYQMRGFRDKKAGAHILGQRHNLNAEVLQTFITRMGRSVPTLQHTNRYESPVEASCLTAPEPSCSDTEAPAGTHHSSSLMEALTDR